MTSRMTPRMVVVAIALLLQGQAYGFSRTPSATTVSRGGKLAMTWSMPSPPSMMNSLSWYTEEDSVIQSSIVYEDNEPVPYTFATPGDDWFSSMGSGEALLAVRPANNSTNTRRVNPIRRAVRWARQGFRRST